MSVCQYGRMLRGRELLHSFKRSSRALSFFQKTISKDQIDSPQKFKALRFHYEVVCFAKVAARTRGFVLSGGSGRVPVVGIGERCVFAGSKGHGVGDR